MKKSGSVVAVISLNIGLNTIQPHNCRYEDVAFKVSTLFLIECSKARSKVYIKVFENFSELKHRYYS